MDDDDPLACFVGSSPSVSRKRTQNGDMGTLPGAGSSLDSSLLVVEVDNSDGLSLACSQQVPVVLGCLQLLWPGIVITTTSKKTKRGGVEAARVARTMSQSGPTRPLSRCCLRVLVPGTEYCGWGVAQRGRSGATKQALFKLRVVVVVVESQKSVLGGRRPPPAPFYHLLVRMYSYGDARCRCVAYRIYLIPVPPG